MTTKTPPSSIDAEQAVIGSVLMSPSCFDDVSFLDPADFYHHKHRELWETIKRDESFRDPVALMIASQSVDDRVYISELVRCSPGTTANVKVYAGIIRDRAMLRRLLGELFTLASEIDEQARPADVVAGAIRRIEAIGDGAIVGAGPRHVADIAGDWYAEFKRRQEAGSAVGVNVGFSNLNARWGGLRGGQVVVIAGRPKTGKTTLATNIAEFVSMTHPVAIFQMEMSAVEMVDRTVASTGRVSITGIRNATLTADEYDRLLDTVTRVRNSKLYIDDTPRQTIDYIRMHAKAFVKRHGKGLLMIDYLGLIRSNSTARSKNDEVAEISRDVKLLAKETDCPVILLCQMNRGVEKEKRKPQLSDLRDSGAIEQDADIICFTHKDDPEQNYSEIITRAMRSGQPGTDYLLCEFGVSRFEEPGEDWTPPYKETGRRMKDKDAFI